MEPGESLLLCFFFFFFFWWVILLVVWCWCGLRVLCVKPAPA